MNVLTVGLLSIAVYVVFLVVWLRYDRNQESYSSPKKDLS